MTREMRTWPTHPFFVLARHSWVLCNLVRVSLQWYCANC